MTAVTVITTVPPSSSALTTDARSDVSTEPVMSIVVAVTPVATTWAAPFAEFVAVTVYDVASVIGDHEICAYDDKPSTAGFDVHVVTG
ncbi:hypothetical protein TB15x_23400, partial [Xanthomonas perforans]